MLTKVFEIPLGNPEVTRLLPRPVSFCDTLLGIREKLLVGGR